MSSPFSPFKESFPFAEHLLAYANEISVESVMVVSGEVAMRPESMRNPKQKNGHIEILLREIHSCSPCRSLPMPMDFGSTAAAAGQTVDQTTAPGSETSSERVRLTHRYLDLRRTIMQRNLRLRSDIVQGVRNTLQSLDCVEVETPALFRSTPEGAREFLVPTRTKDKYYALVQSPQQYKQLLMVAGFDRYFQIAKCFRDELGRKDRQPEFTQIDIELSFVSKDDIMCITEQLLSNIWNTYHESAEKLRYLIPALPKLGIFPEVVDRIPYAQVMSAYGSDKPDRRFGMEIQNVSSCFQQEIGQIFPPFKHVIESPNVQLCEQETKYSLDQITPQKTSIRAFNAKGMRKLLSRKQLDQVLSQAKNSCGEGQAWRIHNKARQDEDEQNAQPPYCMPLQLKDDGSRWKGKIGEYMTSEQRSLLQKSLNVEPHDIVFVSAGWGEDPLRLLGSIRSILGDIRSEKPPTQFDRPDLYWVVDFPLFEINDEEEGSAVGGLALKSAHHPFTAPAPEATDTIWKMGTSTIDVDTLLSSASQHFDLVMNGSEIGGGSVRIHDAALQAHILSEILGLSEEVVKSFDHLLKGLDSGCPPHGGIALGLDRLLAVLIQADSIRDVIAFPKSAQGNELMTGAPSSATAAQLKEYHISSSG